MPTILVVEDEPAIMELLRVNLVDAGYDVAEAIDAEAAQQALRARLPDLMLLDWMLPGQSGLALARQLRSESRTRELPIIMVTARADEGDKVAGLEALVDDYVTKPFSPRELRARIKAVLRRKAPEAAQQMLTSGLLRLDPIKHRVMVGETEIALGPTEFRLLRHFLENPGRVFSRERLLDAVWSHDPEIDLRTVDVHVRRLRKALNEDGRKDIIRTVRSAGYALDAEV